MNFSGTYDHSFDVKNRLTVPAKARAALADGVTIVRSPRGCLQLWATAAYLAQVEKRLAGEDLFSPRGQQLHTYFHGLARHTELDKAGRVAVPADLLAKVGLGKEATLVGAGQWLDVWSPERCPINEDSFMDEVADLLADGHPA